MADLENQLTRGIVIVISGPSGVGKGTIIKRAMAERPSICMATSATTRAPRPGEIDGADYFFLSAEKFDQKIAEDDFLEWCQVHGNRYGTLKSEVVQKLENGYDVILEIDIQGADKVRRMLGSVVSIFITPPTFEDLIDRLHGRNTEAAEVINRRLAMAGKELSAMGEYDYILVNNNIDTATEDFLAIIDMVKKDSIG